MDNNRRKNREYRRKRYRTDPKYREKRKASARIRMDKLRRKRGIPRARRRFRFKTRLRSVGPFAVPLFTDPGCGGSKRGLVVLVDV